MLYNTKINEFTNYEINVLLSVVEDRIDTLNGSIQRVSAWEDSAVKNDLHEQYSRELDSFILWKVQLENAKRDIKEMNKVNLN